MTLAKVGQIFLSVILATGWGWTKVLEDLGKVSAEQRFNTLILLTLILVIQQIYLALPAPAERSVLEARRTITEAYLKGFLSRYYLVLRQSHRRRDQQYPIVRVNIMLPTREGRSSRYDFLNIGYHACPENTVYTEKELSLPWGKDEGTCGWAWRTKTISVFDSVEEDLQMPASRLQPHQRRVVRRINSTLSIPIWHNNKIVGVFNLDSRENIARTKFLDNRVLEIANACAEHLGVQCFENGVKP